MAVQTKLQVRRDTAANWTSTNPTLASGEIGFETDTLKFKIGNGSTAWTSLGYQAAVFNGGTITNALTVSNTSGIDTTGNVTGNVIISTNNGNGTNFKVGDDAWLGDFNTANSLRIKGQQNTANAYIVFGDSDATALGRAGTGNLTYGGNTVWHAGNDGLGSGLDADTLDGFGTSTANSANTIVVRSSGGDINANVVNGVRFISNVAIGTAPFTVTSTTQVANLNVAISGSTSNVLGGAAGSLPYQSAANTTTYLARTATNNSYLAFNSSTNAPFWVTPTLSNTYYAATTSAQLAGVISDETGTGNLVFSTSPTLVTPALGTPSSGNLASTTGYATANLTGAGTGVLTFLATPTSANLATAVTDETGSGALVFGTAPTITPANAVAATSASTAGYIGMPQISVSANTAILATHAGKHIYTTTTSLTHTIPANSNVAFEIGTAITFVTAPSVSLSIAITTDTLRLANSTSTGTRTLAANGVATAIKVTSTAWIISGNGLT